MHYARRVDRAVQYIAVGYLWLMALCLALGFVVKWQKAVAWAQTSYASAER